MLHRHSIRKICMKIIHSGIKKLYRVILTVIFKLQQISCVKFTAVCIENQLIKNKLTDTVCNVVGVIIMLLTEWTHIWGRIIFKRIHIPFLIRNFSTSSMKPQFAQITIYPVLSTNISSITYGIIF